MNKYLLYILGGLGIVALLYFIHPTSMYPSEAVALCKVHGGFDVAVANGGWWCVDKNNVAIGLVLHTRDGKYVYVPADIATAYAQTTTAQHNVVPICSGATAAVAVSTVTER